jgi:hypothetical protein
LELDLKNVFRDQMKIQGIKEAVQFPVGEIFLFSKMSKLAVEPTQSSIQ